MGFIRKKGVMPEYWRGSKYCKIHLLLKKKLKLAYNEETWERKCMNYTWTITFIHLFIHNVFLSISVNICQQNYIQVGEGVWISIFLIDILTIYTIGILQRLTLCPKHRKIIAMTEFELFYNMFITFYYPFNSRVVMTTFIWTSHRLEGRAHSLGCITQGTFRE